MQTVTEKIITAGLANRIIRGEQLKRLIDGSAGRRYGLVNRALKKGELIRLQRGRYILADEYRQQSIHPFVLAQGIAPGSYISFDTALSYHGWIPEKVFTTASVLPGRKSRKYTSALFGDFTFTPLAIVKGSFLELVARQRLAGQTVLIAEPCRALMDLICLRKVRWQGIEWLTEGLRIDPDLLNGISKDELKRLQHTYKHKRVKSFISLLGKELFND